MSFMTSPHAKLPITWSKKPRTPTQDAFLEVSSEGELWVCTEEYDCGRLSREDALKLALLIIKRAVRV